MEAGLPLIAVKHSERLTYDYYHTQGEHPSLVSKTSPKTVNCPTYSLQKELELIYVNNRLKQVYSLTQRTDYPKKEEERVGQILM